MTFGKGHDKSTGRDERYSRQALQNELNGQPYGVRVAGLPADLGSAPMPAVSAAYVPPARSIRLPSRGADISAIVARELVQHGVKRVRSVDIVQRQGSIELNIATDANGLRLGLPISGEKSLAQVRSAMAGFSQAYNSGKF